MPNRKELRSLTNYETSNGASYLAGQGFQNVENLYWTSTTSAVTPANAYINYFAPAEKVEEWSKTTGGSWRPWAVRAGGASDISLSPGALDFGDGVIDQTSTIQTITITNNGSIDLVISTIEMTGTSPTMFARGARGNQRLRHSQCHGHTRRILYPGCHVHTGHSPRPQRCPPLCQFQRSRHSTYPGVPLRYWSQALYAPLEGTVGTVITIHRFRSSETPKARSSSVQLLQRSPAGRIHALPQR